MPTNNVSEIIGIYSADGGLRGELTCVIGKFAGNVHCELCDITYSPVRRKKAWDEFVNRLAVPLRLLHRNEAESETDLANAARGELPCILARTDLGGVFRLLGPAELAAADGDVEKFERTLSTALAAQGFRL